MLARCGDFEQFERSRATENASDQMERSCKKRGDETGVLTRRSSRVDSGGGEVGIGNPIGRLRLAIVVMDRKFYFFRSFRSPPFGTFSQKRGARVFHPRDSRDSSPDFRSRHFGGVGIVCFQVHSHPLDAAARVALEEKSHRVGWLSAHHPIVDGEDRVDGGPQGE